MKPSRVETAAGGVVWREGSDGVEVLLVHRPRYQDWTFPKGKLESGESIVECARREVGEEAGVSPTIGRYLGEISYIKPQGRQKVVHYWAMQAGRVRFQPSSEVDKIRWVGEHQLSDRVSYSTERELVQRLGEEWRQPADRILLTRHAAAGTRIKGSDLDSARPLSQRGHQQAEGLIEQLQGFEIKIIFTSFATRCHQTVVPLAVSRRKIPMLTQELWEESGAAEVSDLLRNRPSGTILLCSHRPIVRMILEMFLGAGAIYPFKKGSTWVLDFIDGSLATANYLSPSIIK